MNTIKTRYTLCEHHKNTLHSGCTGRLLFWEWSGLFEILFEHSANTIRTRYVCAQAIYSRGNDHETPAVRASKNVCVNTVWTQCEHRIHTLHTQTAIPLMSQQRRIRKYLYAHSLNTIRTQHEHIMNTTWTPYEHAIHKDNTSPQGFLLHPYEHIVNTIWTHCEHHMNTLYTQAIFPLRALCSRERRTRFFDSFYKPWAHGVCVCARSCVCVRMCVNVCGKHLVSCYACVIPMWHYSIIYDICVTWLIHMCDDMTHSYVWHDSFICETWLIHMCDIIQSYVWHYLLQK